MRLGYLNTCNCCDKKITAQEMSALKNVKFKCDKLNSNLPSLQAFPSIICGHNFCFKCAKSCLIKSMELPKGCQQEMDINQAYWYVKGQCIKCDKEFFKYEDIFMYKNCNCLTCKDCMLQEKKTNAKYARFLILGIFSTYSRIQRTERKTNERLSCLWVKERHRSYDHVSKCAHFICPDCIKVTEKLYKENSEIIKIFKCFDHECNAPISVEQLEEFFSLHKINLARKQLLGQGQLVENQAGHKNFQMSQLSC